MNKKYFILLFGILVLGLSVSGWALAPVVAVDTVLKGVDTNGLQTFSGTTDITVRVVLIEPYSHQVHNSARFSYYGIDTATGRGLDIGYFAAAGNNLDTTVWGGGPPLPGQRVGTMLFAQGSVVQFNGLIELVFDPADTTAVQLIGTGYAVPTTVLPSLAAITSFDQTLQSGGELYEGKLLRVNNVHFDPATLAISSTAGSNINLLDATGAVTVVFRVDGGAAGNGISAILIGQLGTSSLPSTSIDLIGVGTQFAATSPRINGYEFTARGLGLDIIPHYGTNPSPSVFTQPNAAPVSLSVFGGFPPYTWSLSTTGLGSLNTTSGATVTFSASSTVGILSAFVTDSAGEKLSITIVITGTSAPMAPDISMESMLVPIEVSKSVIKPSDR